MKVVLVFLLIGVASTRARPDFGIALTIQGSSTGNLQGSGNINANAQSLSATVSNIKQQLNSLKLSGVNQTLSATLSALMASANDLQNYMTFLAKNLTDGATNNKAQLASVVFPPINASLNNAVIALINTNATIEQYRQMIGDNVTNNIEYLLTNITSSIANIQYSLTNINSAFMIIKALPVISSATITQYLPNNDIVNINWSLRWMTNSVKTLAAMIVDSAKGIVGVDTFNSTVAQAIAKSNATVMTLLGTNYNALNNLGLTYANAINSTYKQAVSLFQGLPSKTAPLLRDTTQTLVEPIYTLNATVAEAFRNVSYEIYFAGYIVTRNFQSATSGVNATVLSATGQLFALMQEMAQNLSVSLANRDQFVDQCVKLYGNQFTTIIGAIATATQFCTTAETTNYPKTVGAQQGYSSTILYNLNAALSGINYCLSLGNAGSSITIKLQISGCLYIVST